MSGAATSQTPPEQAGSGRPSRGHTRAASYTHSPYEPVTTPTPGDEDSSENKVQQQQQQGGAPQRFSGHQRSASQQSSTTPNASFSGRGMRGGPSHATGTDLSPAKPNPSLMGKSWYDYTDSPDKAGGGGGGQSSSPGGFEGSSPPGRGGAAGGSGHLRGESGASHSYDSEIGVVMHGGIGGSAAATGGGGGPGRSGSNSRPAGHSRTTSTNSTSFTHSPYGSGGGAANHSRQGSLQYNQNLQNQQQQELSDTNSPLGGSQQQQHHHQDSFVPQVTVVPRRGHGRTESTQSHTSVVSLDEANSSLRIFSRGAGHSRQASRDDGGTSSPPQGLHHQRQSSYQPMTVTSSNDPVAGSGGAGTGDPSPHYLPTVVGPAPLQRMNTDAYDSGIHNPSHPNFPDADPRYHHHHHAAVDNNPQQRQYQQQQQHSTSYSPASMQLVTDQQQQYQQQQQPADGYYGGTGGFSGDPAGAASASSSFYGGHTTYTTGSEASGGGVGHRPAGHQPTFSQVSMISSTASPLHPNSFSNVADFGGGSSLSGEVQTPTIRVGGPVVKVKGRLVDPPSSLNQSFNPEKSWRTVEEQQEGTTCSTTDKTSPTPTTSTNEKNKKISSVKSPGGRSLPPQSPNSTLPTGGGDFARVSPTTRHAAAKSAMSTPSAIAGGGKPTHLMIARAAAAKAAGENSSSSATTGGKSQHRKTQSNQSKDSNTSCQEVKEPMTPTPGMSMASFHRRQMSATAVVPGSSSVGNSLTRSTPHGGESSAFDNANNNNGSSSMGSPQLTIGGSSTVGSGGAMTLDAEAFARRPESDYSGGYGAMHSRNHSLYENQSPAGSPNAMMVNTFPTGSQQQQQHSTSQHQTPGGGEAGGNFHSFPHTPPLQGGAAGLVQNGIVMSAHSRCSSSTNITDATTNASQYPMRSKNLFHRKLKGKMEYIPYPSKEYLLQEMRRHQLRQQKEASATAELEKKKNEAAAATASSSSKSETADTKEEEKASRGGIGDGAASSPPRSGGGATTTAASPSPILGQPYKGEPTEFGCFFGQVKFESTIELMAWLIRALTTPEVSAPGRIPASQQTSSHRGSSRPSEASMSEAGLSSPPMPSSIKMDKRSSAGVDSSSVVTNGSIAENSSSLQTEETLPYVAGGGGGASGSNKAQPSPPVPEDDQASTVVVQQDSQSAASCSSSSALPAIDISYMHPRGNGCWMAYFASLEDWERVMEFNSRVLWDEHGVWVARTPTECEVLKAYISKIGRPPKGVRLPKEPMIIRK